MTGRDLGRCFPENHRHSVCWVVIGFLLLVGTVPMVAAQSALAPAIPLTTEERSWLQAHPTIRFGFMEGYDPYLMTDAQGNQSGILIDLREELGRRLGANIIVKQYKTIPDLLKASETKEIDAVYCILPQRARKRGLLHTGVFLRSYVAVYTRDEDTFNVPDEMTGKTVAIPADAGYAKLFVQPYLEKATIVVADTPADGLRMLQNGEVDLFVGTTTHNYLANKYRFFGIHAAYVHTDQVNPFAMGVRSDWPELVAILDKGLASFGPHGIEKIVAQWTQSPEPAEGIDLSVEERAWLAAHPDITLGYTDAFEPEVIVDADGSQRGMLVDFMAELNRRLGTRIGLEIDTIPGILEKAQTKTVDGILEIHPEYAAKLGLLKTESYLAAYPAVFGRRNVSFKGPTDFSGKKVAIIDGVYFSEKMVRQYGQQAALVKVKNAEQGIKAVSAGDVDLYIGTGFNTYLITKYQLFDVVAKYTFSDYPDRFGMAVRPDWPELVSILNKGIESFSRNEIDAIVARWIHVPQPKARIAFTPEERAWLVQNHIVRVRAVEWPPYLIVKGNKPPQGISIEYLDLIGNRTGITFKYEITDQPFAAFIESMKRHEGPDMTLAIVPTPDREQYLSFSETYITSPYVIFIREKDELILDINGLTGKTVAVPRGFSVQQQLANDYPEIQLALVASDEQALEAVATGQADAYVGNLTAASHIIHRRGFEGLRVAAPSPFGEQSLSIGNRNDWPELTSIINKALASITEDEKTTIRNKYVALKYEQGINRATVIRWILIGCFGASGVVLLFFIWNRSLAGRVRQRTIELEHTAEILKTEIAEKIETEAALRYSRRYTERLIETANVMIVGLDIKGNVNLFNPAAEKSTGYTLSELHGKNWFELLIPKDRYLHVHQEFYRLMSGGLPRLFQNPILTKSGEERVITWSNNEIKEGDNVTGLLSFGIDITERKRAEEALVESEAQFRSLVEQSPFSIQIINTSGQIVMVNQAFMDLWGVDEESLAEVLEKYNILEDQEAIEKGVMPLIKKVFMGKAVTLPVIEYDAASSLESAGVTDGIGNKRWVQARLYPVKNNNGEVVYVVDVEEDITERKLAEHKIEQHQQRLKALASQLTIAEEKERRTIAADLHDHVGHSLALARMQLNDILECGSELERKILVKDISTILLQALQETRSLIFELSSPSMNEIGLGAAISEWLEEQIEKRYGLKTEFSDRIAGEKRGILDKNVRALMFRNVRELLTNVVKHAKAQKVTVLLKDQDKGVAVEVTDDGIGFDIDAVKKQNNKEGGFGLFSIHERMTDLGGRLDIQSTPGEGCKVVLTVPVEKGNITLNRRKSDGNGVME